MKCGFRIPFFLMSTCVAMLLAVSSSAMDKDNKSGGTKVVKGYVIVTKSGDAVSNVKIMTENVGVLIVPEQSKGEFIKFDGRTIKIECNIEGGKLVPLKVAPPIERTKKEDNGKKA